MRNPCTTFTRIFSKLWNSPTFTTWGNQAVQALRLLAVTPLILISFNETEIASWLLFGSLTFFGSIISGRVGLTFSRMIAFAMGGATDLSPIKQRPAKIEKALPNWILVERAYSTTGAINALLATLVAAVAVFMGWYGLDGLLAGYADTRTIWMAFGIVVISQSAVFLFQQYPMALRGMDYVALSNRWNVVFSLLSMFTGVITLKMGGGIITVTLAMQIVVMLAIPRNWWLLRSVEDGRFKNFKAYRLDRQMLEWAWEPAWKGFIVSLANSGSLQVAAVFCARFLPVSEAAAALLSLRLLTSLKYVSNAPYMSRLPRISRMFAEGHLDRLKQFVPHRIFLCQLLFSLSVLGLGYLGPPLLNLIGSNVELLPRSILLVTGLLLLLQNFVRLSLILSATGNHIICVQREFWAFWATALSLFFLIPNLGFSGLLVGLFLPAFLILNIAPVQVAVNKLEFSLVSFTVSTTALSVGVTLAGLGVSIFILRN